MNVNIKGGLKYELYKNHLTATKVLDNDDIHILRKYGLGLHIFCTICDEQNPTGLDFGESGYHFVNVMERFVFPNPLPAELYVEEVNYGVLYGE